MIQIHPFRAIRPSAARVREFTTPRLDHLGDEARAEHAARAPRGLASMLEAGAPFLQELVDSRALIRHAEPLLFMHRQVRAGRVSVALLACVDPRSFASGAVRGHRRAHAGRVEAWRRASRSLQLHADPVVMGFDATPAILELFEREMNDRPLFHVVADDGATHTLWAGSRMAAMVEAFASVREALLLEGHHRAHAADAAEPRLSMLVPFDHVTLRASVASLPVGCDSVARIAAAGKEIPRDAIAARGPGQAAVCVPGAGGAGVRWFACAVPHAFDAAVAEVETWAGAGSSCVWRPGDPVDAEAIERRVHEGAAAVWLPDPAIGDVRSLAAAGALLPASSTWCEPRFRSGLCMADPREAATTIRE